MLVRANKISLNTSKTVFIIFKSKHKSLNMTPALKLEGKPIYSSLSVKYLGVYLDENLCWKPHMNHVALKLQRALMVF